MAETLEQKWETFRERYRGEHPELGPHILVPSLAAFEAGYYRREEEEPEETPEWRKGNNKVNALKYAVKAADLFGFDDDGNIKKDVLTFAREFEAYLNGPAAQPGLGDTAVQQ